MTSHNVKKKQILKKGVGFNKLKKLYNKIGLNFNKKTINVRLKHQRVIVNTINKLSYSGTLKIKVKSAINFYTKIRNYRGIRHLARYPVRGQRTHTNAKTARKLK